MKSKLVVSLIAMRLALFTVPARGQSTFGNLVGVVQDQSHAVVTDAAIHLRSLDDNSTRSSSSLSDGSFQFLNLKAGRYSIAIKKEGFSEFSVASVTVDARQTARVRHGLARGDRPGGRVRLAGGPFRHAVDAKRLP